MKTYIKSNDETNYMNMTEAEWIANNEKIESDFAKWLDSSNKSAFEADPYSVFEKMSLAEVRRWLTPASEDDRYSYNSEDYVEEDTWYYIIYNDGSTLSLSPGDSLVGVKRGNILVCIQDNPCTSIIYAKRGSSDVSIYNDARFEENFDIWRWDTNL